MVAISFCNWCTTFLQCFDSKLFQICTCNLLHESQVGVLDGQGFSVNIPWSRGGVGDDDYIFAFQTVVLPIGNNKIALRCVLLLFLYAVF